jgi:hypothetical protein
MASRCVYSCYTAVVATFLIRSFSDPRGYSEKICPNDELPRSKAESYVPWAMIGDKVVYALTGEHTSWRAAGGLKPYDTNVSQQRRRVCESLLGAFALRNPGYTASAVSCVSTGVKKYLTTAFFRDQERTLKIVYDEIGHYFFTAGGKGFGRISEVDKKSMSPKDVFTAIVDTVSMGRVEQKLSIHDAVGRKLLPKISSGASPAYEHWGPALRGDWFDDKDRRGRANAQTRVPATTMAGTVPGSDAGRVPTLEQSRNRGVDMFVRDVNRKRHAEADDYYDDLDTRNLLFGAGISGTTGSLLQAAIAFGGLGPGEMLKEYTLAIIGYLVGGGMHSYHESMVIAQKAGVPYNPGAFKDSLPASFSSSGDFKAWGVQYYDVVYLGAIHWRYNPGVVPSHLNKQLRA